MYGVSIKKCYTKEVINPSTFFFYDLETSGFNPKTQRIMQFAGQRTDMGLNPVGDPINVLVALADDVLPDPSAVMITGITPQKTLEEGYSEADFLKILHEQVLLPNTIITGFNNVRFDDEFMRYTLYRNFYDPYEWCWQDGRSRWDILDAIRMTRALRPGGIEWPVDSEGQPTNRLELLSTENGLNHAHAHDALSDVQALIDVAKLIKQQQPKLFDYLLKTRSKNQVATLVSLDNPQPFVYTSGRYPKGTLHTTVAYPVAPGGTPGSVIVYDLRHDPAEWADMSIPELKEIRFANSQRRQMEGFLPLPAKELAYNRCPVVAPLGVLDQSAQERIVLDVDQIQDHLQTLRRTDLPDKLREVFARSGDFAKNTDPDCQLYDGFINDKDKPKMSAVRAATVHQLADFDPGFADERLAALLVRYKARNYPASLSQSERATWEAYRSARLAADLPRFAKDLHHCAAMYKSNSHQFLLQELRLWAESVTPLPE